MQLQRSAATHIIQLCALPGYAGLLLLQEWPLCQQWKRNSLILLNLNFSALSLYMTALRQLHMQITIAIWATTCSRWLIVYNEICGRKHSRCTLEIYYAEHTPNRLSFHQGKVSVIKYRTRNQIHNASCP